MRVAVVTVLLAVFFVAVAFADTEDQLDPPEVVDLDDLQTTTQFVDEEQPIGVEEGDIIGDESGIGGSTAHEQDACSIDPTSGECEKLKAERKSREDYMSSVSESHNRTEKDLNRYEDIVLRFERLTNDWCCAVSGHALFNVSGDQDVMHYMFFYLSQVFDYEGQQYGSRVVLEFHRSRENEKTMYNCDAVQLGDTTAYAAPVEAIMEYKELLSVWLSENEVDPGPIVSSFMPQAKQLYGRWVRSRMQFTVRLSGDDLPSADEDAVMGTLPLITGDLEPKDECEAGGELYALVPRPREGGGLGHEIQRLLQVCIDHGKIAADPKPFADTLLATDKQDEARRLYDLAVERGVLCNAWQRPDAHHRKDLRAIPAWSVSAVPGLADAMEQVAAALGAKAAAVETDEDLMSTNVEHGTWGRVGLYGRNSVNYTLCDELGVSAAIEAAAKAIIDANDGYLTMCNGSLSIEIWRFSPGAKTWAATGASNIVLQAVRPMPDSHASLVVQLGEDTARVEAADTRPLVFDDTFENVLSVSNSSDGGLTLLNFQVCHPDLHDKALDAPSTRCADADE